MERLARLGAHVTNPYPAAASTQPSAPPRLLSESQVISFIKEGYAVLPLPPSEVSSATHESCTSQIERLWNLAGGDEDAQDTLGNNIYPAVPELGSILEAPTVRGAVQSVLGGEAVLHGHRALHVAWERDQGFHKDTAEG
jgi:hypothetical protein